MKDLVTFIKEELSDSQLKRIKATRDIQKKKDLVAVKKAFDNIEEEELNSLIKNGYETVGKYKDPDDLFDAYDGGRIAELTKLQDEIKKQNGGKEIDFDTLLDVVEQIAIGKDVDTAITIVAKKI